MLHGSKYGSGSGKTLEIGKRWMFLRVQEWGEEQIGEI